MAERAISLAQLLEVMDFGDTRHSDAASVNLWAYKALPGRDDNLICAVPVLEDAVVVKTVMHHFAFEA